MKISKAVILVLMNLFFLSADLSYSASMGDIRISFVEGDVTVRQDDSSDWVPCVSNVPLMEGATLWVPEGARVELQLSDGTFIRLNERLSFQILRATKNSYQFSFLSGDIYVNFRKLNANVIQIDAPISVARTYDQSIFRKSVSPEAFTKISVFKGSVVAENSAGTTTVREGNSLSFGKDINAEISPVKQPPDEWQNWNTERDKIVDTRGVSHRYLPGELRPYSKDLDDNGRWKFVKEYGYVWTPAVIDSAEWAPYRTGRWTWIGGDYVWVSFEPWGWAPYHYGRWDFMASIGWFWVPPVRGDVFWGPGYVGWVQTPEYVAWVPLAPKEIYHGYGHYGRHSHDISRVDISRINIPNVYKNAHVQNSVTVINNKTFIHGHPVGQSGFTDRNVRENPFLTNRINVGRPLIKPEKSTMMPVLRDTPESKQPPQHIKDLQVRQLRESHPLVTDRKFSVLKPGSRIVEMPVRNMSNTKKIATEPGGVKTGGRGSKVKPGKGSVGTGPAGTGPGGGKPGGGGTKVGRDRKPGGVAPGGARPEVRKPMIQGPNAGTGRRPGGAGPVGPRPGGSRTPGVGGSPEGTHRSPGSVAPGDSKGHNDH